MNDDLCFRPAVDVAALVRKGDVSPVELATAYLDRIDRLDPALGAYFTVAADTALSTAARAEAEAVRARREGGADSLPPLLGVPVSIKDLNDTAGIRTTHGSRLFADNVPVDDDATVSRIRAAGAVVLGKTAVPEFGWSFVSEAPAFSPARNPWDPQHTPGGSSGGAAAALAAGLCALSQGSDAGGSIRVPSSFTNLFGIKPSRGRVPDSPHPARLLWQNGPIARTVEDAAVTLDVLAGYSWGDPWWAPEPARPFRAEVGADPGRLRVACSFGGAEVAAGNRAAVQAAAELLCELGHVVVDADPVPDWAVTSEGAVEPAALAFVGVQVSQHPGLPLADEIDLEALDPSNRRYLEAASGLRAVDYARMWDALAVRARAVVSFFDRFDMLLTPTVAGPPLPVGAFRDGPVEAMLLAWYRMAPFTSLWNITGQPAVSVPMGFDEAGLPTGVQLVGRPAAEATLIRASAQLEAARPWADRRPPTAAVRDIVANGVT
ncbi:MAG TPA: amidase [Acidimicrobiales bacterium]|nr:amidase [Acidimicrobiales bacterium]